MNNVAVVGCGPAGILTAYAALQNGYNVTIYRPPGVGRSVIHGAQFIHGDITGLPPSIQPFKVRYKKFGSEEGYREKIYGKNVPEGGTSWSTFGGLQWALPMHEVYGYLYAVAELNTEFVYKVVDEDFIMEMVDSYDFVLNTAPLRLIKPQGEYRCETVWTLARNMMDVPEDEIWYRGDEDCRAYRASNIAGWCSTEYPSHKAVPVRWRHKAVEVVKPLDCQVDLPGVYRLGRYGKWQKGQLAHHAYEETHRILERRLSWTATLPV